MEFTHMESMAINQISIESFSYRWLSNINPNFDFGRLGDSLRRSLEAVDGDSFIEMDPDCFSIRWTDVTCFDFSLPSSCESSNLVHADQIFSNGQLLPLTTLTKKEAFFSSVSITSSNSLPSKRSHWDDSVSIDTSSYSMPLKSGAKKLKLPLHRQNSTGKTIRKYLNFLIPLLKQVRKLKIMSLRTTQRIGDSPTSSVRTEKESLSVERSRGNRVTNWEFECSIHDAVLHCKKSIANSN